MRYDTWARLKGGEAVRVQDAGTNSAGNLSYTWTFPGAPIRVRLGIEVVRRINREIGVALDAAGADQEMWGLLLGRCDSPGNVEVLAQRSLGAPIASSLSVELKASLNERAIAQARGANERLSVVGFYRTGCDHFIRLRDDDLALIERHFKEPGNVFLVIDYRSDDPQGSRAGFFFWDENRLHASFSFLEFPFDSDTLRGRVTPEPSPVPPISTPAPPAYEMEISEKAPSGSHTADVSPEGKPRIPAFAKYAAAAVAVLGILAAGGWFFFRHGSEPATPSVVKEAEQPKDPASVPSKPVAKSSTPVQPAKHTSKSQSEHPSERSRDASPSFPRVEVVAQVLPPAAGQRSAEAQPKYSPAKPLERPNPIIPAELRHAASAIITVQVRVRVDASGRVTAVSPVTQDTSNMRFVNFAMSAAKDWTFEPARWGDQAVASEAVLEFRFVPDRQ